MSLKGHWTALDPQMTVTHMKRCSTSTIHMSRQVLPSPIGVTCVRHQLERILTGLHLLLHTRPICWRHILEAVNSTIKWWHSCLELSHTLRRMSYGIGAARPTQRKVRVSFSRCRTTGLTAKMIGTQGLKAQTVTPMEMSEVTSIAAVAAVWPGRTKSGQFLQMT